MFKNSHFIVRVCFENQHGAPAHADSIPMPWEQAKRLRQEFRNSGIETRLIIFEGKMIGDMLAQQAANQLTFGAM